MISSLDNNNRFSKDSFPHFFSETFANDQVKATSINRKKSLAEMSALYHNIKPYSEQGIDLLNEAIIIFESLADNLAFEDRIEAHEYNCYSALAKFAIA